MVLRDTWKTVEENEKIKEQKDTVARLMQKVEELENSLNEKAKEADSFKAKFEESEKKLLTLETSSMDEKQSLEKKIKEDEISLKNQILVCFVVFYVFMPLFRNSRKKMHLKSAKHILTKSD
jgi:chromosome segregation ATPase